MRLLAAHRVLLVCLGAVVLFGACSSDGPTDPSAFTGSYRLDLVNTQPIPFVHLLAPLTGDTLMIVNAEVDVLSRGRLRLVRFFQWRPRNAPPETVVSDTLVRNFREEAGLVLIDHPASSIQPAFVDTVQVLQNSISIDALLVLPITISQSPPMRRTMFYVRD